MARARPAFPTRRRPARRRLAWVWLRPGLAQAPWRGASPGASALAERHRGAHPRDRLRGRDGQLPPRESRCAGHRARSLRRPVRRRRPRRRRVPRPSRRGRHALPGRGVRSRLLVQRFRARGGSGSGPGRGDASDEARRRDLPPLRPALPSSYGLHASLSITVPFCHVLFERPALESYVAERGLKPIPFATVNGWRLGRFRDLWRRHAASIEPEVYREIPSLHGIDLVAEYPSCFRSKTDDFDDLLVADVEARCPPTARVTSQPPAQARVATLRGATSTNSRCQSSNISSVQMPCEWSCTPAA